MNKDKQYEAEKAIYGAEVSLKAVRGLAFLFFQAQEGSAHWGSDQISDIESLLTVISDQGLEHTRHGLEVLTGFGSEEKKTA